jgi:hypothetical protein
MILPRSWKDADGAAATREFLRRPALRLGAIRDLMKELLSKDPFGRRCAADLARRISAREPGILGEYADLLIDLAADLPLDEWQARGYVTLAAALNVQRRAQRLKLAVLVRALAEDRRNALRAIALEASAILAATEPELRDQVILLLEQARIDGTPAMRTRAKRMLMMLASNRKTDGICLDRAVYQRSEMSYKRKV